MPKMKVFQDFRGGWNTDKSPEKLSEKELELADNVDYSRRGSLQKRGDVTNYNNTSYGQQVETVFEWPKSNGVSELMAVMEDQYLYKIDGPDSKTQIFQLFGTYINYFILQNYLYLVDGNNYYRIDDETFNYEVVPERDVSEILDYGEEFDAEIGTAHTLEEENLVSDSETVYKASDMETTFVEGTDYSINYGDVDTKGSITPLSGGNMKEGEPYYIVYDYEVPSDNDLTPIKKCQYVIRHPKSYRIFAAGNPNDPKALYFSEYNDPEYFKEISVLYPTTNDGPIQGLAVLDEMLAVFFEHTIWVWRGIDPATDAVWEKLPVKHGTYNHKTIETTQGSLIFLDTGGIYALNSSKGIQNITDNKVAKEINNIENGSYVTSKYDPNNHRLLVGYSDIGGRNDKILTLDWNIGAYSRWTSLSPNDFCYTRDGELLMATDNYIKKMNQSNGTNSINFHIKSKKLNLENPYYHKLIKNLFLTFDTLPDGVTITANILFDDSTVETLDITNKAVRKKILEKGLKLQLEIQEDSTENIILFNWGLEYEIVNTYREQL